MKTLIVSLIALAFSASIGLTQNQVANFGAQKSPSDATVVIKSVDFETTANIDILLPANFKYKVDSVQSVVRTAPSAVTTAPRVGLSSYDGTTATETHGSVAAEADAVGEIDTLFSSGTSGSGYFYTEDVAAATTSGNCTQNTTLNSAGAIASPVSPLHARKLVITTVDNAGDDLAGTVTLVGTNAQGETITEVVTIVAGTDTHTTTSAFATLTSGAHDFGATATVTVDTLDIGMSVQIALPHKNARVYRALTAGVADTVAAEDVAEGTYSLTDAPDGITEQEVYYRYTSIETAHDGGNYLRVAITGGTVTGSDVRDIIVKITKY